MSVIMLYCYDVVPGLLVYFVTVDVVQLAHAAVMDSRQHIWPFLITVNVQQQFVQQTWLSEKWHSLTSNLLT